MQIQKLNLIRKIEGWLTDNEMICLHNLAYNSPKNAIILEIGSWKGKSAITMATSFQESDMKTIYCIDPHTGSEEHQKKNLKINTYSDFLSNIKKFKVNKYIKPIRKTSLEARVSFSSKIDLLFIDGDHSHNGCLLDYALWQPIVKEGGIIAFHDTRGKWTGPRKVVVNQIFLSRNFKDIRFSDSIVYARKSTTFSVKSLINNYFMLIYFYFLYLRGRLFSLFKSFFPAL